MQQGFFQRLECRELALVDSFEALGLGEQIFKPCRRFFLFLQRRECDSNLPQVADINLHQCSTISSLTDLALNRFRNHQEVAKVLVKKGFIENDRDDTSGDIRTNKLE